VGGGWVVGVGGWGLGLVVVVVVGGGMGGRGKMGGASGERGGPEGCHVPVFECSKTKSNRNMDELVW
jgi:hypothetical protein